MYCFNCGKRVIKGKSFCHHCGSPIPDIPRLRPDTGLPRRRPRRRTPLVVTVVTVCVILLIAGEFLVMQVVGGGFLSPGADRAAETSTSLAQAPAPSTTDSTLAVTTTTGPTSTTLPPTTTTASSTTTASESTTTTDAGARLVSTYLAATETLVRTLVGGDQEMARVSEQISGTAPSVPQAVVDTLAQMLSSLAAAYDEANSVQTPPAFADSDRLLDQAAGYMSRRIQYAIEGIQAMWSAGRTSASNASFTKARQARDSFQSAFASYQQLVAQR